MVSETNHEFVLESEADLNCPVAEPICGFVGHLGVIINQEGTTFDQGGSCERTQH